MKFRFKGKFHAACLQKAMVGSAYIRIIPYYENHDTILPIPKRKMHMKFKTILAILPALSSTAFGACYMSKPAWTELATEEQIFKAFRNSCERIQGKHAAGVSTCDSANGDIMSKDGGSYFLSIEPYKKAEWNLSVDTCLLLAGEVSKAMLVTPHNAGELLRLSFFFCSSHKSWYPLWMCEMLTF